MTNGRNELRSGLEGVAVAETALSHVNGAEGRLIVAGSDVEELASTASFEEVAGRLWASDGAPIPAPQIAAALGEGRVAAFELLPSLGSALDAPDAMDALRASVAHLVEARDADERWRPSAELAGAVAVFAAAWARRRAGATPVAPEPSLRHGADYLRMLRGSEAAPHEVRALDAYLVTVVDHGLNASTFAARVVASTGSDLVSAVTAAIGALKGPLHGGAPGPVLDMLDLVRVPERARTVVEHEMDARRRIMGMGHRVYRVRDPRAAVLERAVERLRAATRTGTDDPTGEVAARLELARAVEREATALLAARYPSRALRANVEFYTAVLLEAIGVPRELFSATFAVARVVGWTAHVDEERRKGRLIRPTSIYVGVMPPDAGKEAAG
ncbi:MAG TPA: citrate synthase [Polyangiaceae bacterium]|jgi:citrate synthase|nr:citrate synthase [Polyangiaceae bacterium]